MVYWICFLLYELSLLYLYKYTNNKKISLILIATGLIYFAGFRDGLGVDYVGYATACEVNYASQLYLFDFFNEPIYTFLQDWIYATQFSPVVFFTFMAIITNVCIVSVYSKYEDFPLLIFIYIIYPSLYVSSFNIVRQFAAGAIFLMAIHIYRTDKKIWTYLILLMIAVMIHKSAIILLFVLLIKDNKINPWIWGGLVLGTLIVPITPILGSISPYLELLDYGSYLQYDETPISKTSLVNFFLHLIFFIFLFNTKKIKSLPNAGGCIFAIKMVGIFLMCYNISANDLPIAYRMAIYFSLFTPILFIYLKEIIDPIIAKNVIIVSLSILFTIGVLLNDSLIPDKMMPINTIYDKSFNINYREAYIIE